MMLCAMDLPAFREACSCTCHPWYKIGLGDDVIICVSRFLPWKRSQARRHRICSTMAKMGCALVRVALCIVNVLHFVLVGRWLGTWLWHVTMFYQFGCGLEFLLVQETFTPRLGRLVDGMFRKELGTYIHGMVVSSYSVNSKI